MARSNFRVEMYRCPGSGRRARRSAPHRSPSCRAGSPCRTAGRRRGRAPRQSADPGRRDRQRGRRPPWRWRRRCPPGRSTACRARTRPAASGPWVTANRSRSRTVPPAAIAIAAAIDTKPRAVIAPSCAMGRLWRHPALRGAAGEARDGGPFVGDDRLSATIHETRRRNLADRGRSSLPHDHLQLTAHRPRAASTPSCPNAARPQT